MNALIDDAALLDDDDDDVSFDEETGEPTRGRENGANGENGFDDSSEEEEDDDEEEAQRVSTVQLFRACLTNIISRYGKTSL